MAAEELSSMMSLTANNPRGPDEVSWLLLADKYAQCFYHTVTDFTANITHNWEKHIDI